MLALPAPAAAHREQLCGCQDNQQLKHTHRERERDGERERGGGRGRERETEREREEGGPQSKCGRLATYGSRRANSAGGC